MKTDEHELEQKQGVVGKYNIIKSRPFGLENSSSTWFLEYYRGTRHFKNES